METMTSTSPVTQTAFRLRPMPAPLCPTSAGVALSVEAPNSYPCRSCLRDGLVGETMRLVSYDPFLGQSPYTGAGPIFVHEGGCEDFDGDAIPPQLLRRLLAVRAYDAAHFMIESEIVEGTDLEEAAARMLAAPDVAYLHAHFARAGCFAVRLDRAS
jgi:hypothetical protein